MRRVLITGGTGFVGSHAVDEFLSAGWVVRALIRNPERKVWLKDLPVEFAVGSVDNIESLRNAAADCDTVVHCAGLTKALRPEELYRVNGDAVGEFAIAARQAGVRRFILCSSQAAAGPSLSGKAVTEDDEAHPLSDYGKSKLAGEFKLRETAGEMEWVILRPPSVMGPRDEQFVPLFRAIVRYGIYPKFGSGAQRYSFIGVFDLARALRVAAESRDGLNETYFVGCDEAISWQEAARVIAVAAGRKARALPISGCTLSLLRLLSEAGARLAKKPALLNRDKLKEILAPGWVCSSEKIKRAWAFSCEVSVEDTLRRTLDAYRQANWI